MRGGVQPIPVNQSSCYYSRKDILNLTAVNSGWNLVHSILENNKAMGTNPFKIYPVNEATQRVQNLMNTPCDSTQRVIQQPRPNIVMIILEGWSGRIVRFTGR